MFWDTISWTRCFIRTVLKRQQLDRGDHKLNLPDLFCTGRYLDCDVVASNICHRIMIAGGGEVNSTSWTFWEDGSGREAFVLIYPFAEALCVGCGIAAGELCGQCVRFEWAVADLACHDNRSNCAGVNWEMEDRGADNQNHTVSIFVIARTTLPAKIYQA
jgi:hypothetical protein